MNAELTRRAVDHWLQTVRAVPCIELSRPADGIVPAQAEKLSFDSLRADSQQLKISACDRRKSCGWVFFSFRRGFATPEPGHIWNSGRLPA
jgi:hypothetical protein